MYCFECGKNYQRKFRCSLCGEYPNGIVEEANEKFNKLAYRDERMRVLVTGLWISNIKTDKSCEGGEGHLKKYPWVELAFGEKNEQMMRLVRIISLYNKEKEEKYWWTIEKRIGNVYWLVPKNKNLPINILYESVEEIGWFFYDFR